MLGHPRDHGLVQVLASKVVFASNLAS